MAIKASLKKTGKAPVVTTDAPKAVDVETTSTDLEAAVAGETPQEAGPGEPANQAVATRPKNTGVARYNDPESGFEGAWGADDLKFPQLKIVQGSGKLSKEFNIGTIIYGDQVLFEPCNKVKKEVPRRLRFVPMLISKQFREKLSQDRVDEGEQARIVNTISEVEECGGTTRWVGDSMPDNYWEASARNLFLIEKPEDNDHPGFALDLDGKQYAVAVYYAAGAAFRASSKVIFNTAKTSLFVPVLDEAGKPVFNGKAPVKRALLYKCFWTIEWDMVTAGKYTPYRPTVRLIKEETGEEVRSYCSDLLTGGAVEAAAGDE